MKAIASVSLIILISICILNAEIDTKSNKAPFLRSFEGFKYDTERGPDGVYRFRFHVGDSSRTEERDESGMVKGEYAFVAPEGDEYEFKYEADKNGYRVDSNALPVKPEETEEVKKAKELFFEEYKKALERAQKSGDDGEDEEEEEDSEEDSEEESSEEDDDEEESYSIFAAYGFGNKVDNEAAGESSEETSEEDDDDYEEEEEEEEGAEEEKGKTELKKEAKPTKKVDTSAYSHFGLRTKPLPYKRRA